MKNRMPEGEVKGAVESAAILQTKTILKQIQFSM